MGGKTAPQLVVPVSDEGEAIAGETRLGDALARALHELGVRSAYGMVGGAIAPLAEALQRSPLQVLHFRHEAGAAFAAVEASFATGRPTALFTTTGPGLTNAITGLTAARWEGAKVILLSATTPRPQQGRWAFQETSPCATPFAGLFSAGHLLHYGVAITDVSELRCVLAALAAGCARPGGFVANIGVPIHLQSAALPPEHAVARVLVGGDTAEASARRCAGILLEESGDRHPFCIWAGFGARHAGKQLKELAERTGVGVMCTPRAKGIFPEDHPQFVGVTGFGGHAGAQAHLSLHRPLRGLVLGTRLGEFSSLWDAELVPERGFVHVDVDGSVPGAAFPNAPVVAVQAEIASFLDALLAHVPAKAKKPAAPTPLEPPKTLPPQAEGPVRPQVLFDAIQRVVVDGSDAMVMTEAGNAFAWGTHALRFRTPRYRVSVGFGSMGHASAGVVGAAQATGKKAVAILGDGALLMLNEISTAAQYRLPAMWIVLNDGLYGMIEQGMRRHGLQPVETRIPQADFVAISRGMGGDGVRVEREADLDEALARGLAAAGPFVVDVVIDPTQQAPIKGRVASLMKQEAAAWR